MTGHTVPLGRPQFYRIVGPPRADAQLWTLVEALDGRMRVRRAGDPDGAPTAVLPDEWLEPAEPLRLDEPPAAWPVIIPGIDGRLVITANGLVQTQAPGMRAVRLDAYGNALAARAFRVLAIEAQP